jgi:hypothetical protein
MENWIIKSNQWYDNLKEPKRFLLFFLFVCLPTGIGNAMMHLGGYYSFIAPIVVVSFALWRILPLYVKKTK